MKKILIVDDEETIQITLKHLLSGPETAVITSSRIEEAEAALSRYVFDLVIADIRLSGMDGIEGLELLSYIRQISPATQVIIMTAYGSETMREEAFRRGAFFYFEKPIDLGVLSEKVKEIGIPPAERASVA